MITASCVICEDVRQEANGQQTWVGLFMDASQNIGRARLSKVVAQVSIHVPFADKDREFGVRVTNGAGHEEYAAPPREYIEAGIADAREHGLDYAVFPATVTVEVQPVPDFWVKIHLSVDGKDHLIRYFAFAAE